MTIRVYRSRRSKEQYLYTDSALRCTLARRNFEIFGPVANCHLRTNPLSSTKALLVDLKHFYLCLVLGAVTRLVNPNAFGTNQLCIYSNDVTGLTPSRVTIYKLHRRRQPFEWLS